MLFIYLGLGDSTSRNVPTLVRDISGVGQVVCGSAHTLALSADGRTVWSFGSGKSSSFSRIFKGNLPYTKV